MSVGGSDEEEVKETPEERQLARIGSERWERWQKVFRPIENKFIERLSDREDLRSAAARGANVSTTMALDEVRKRMDVNNMNRGARPGSGAFNSTYTGAEAPAAHAIGQTRARNIADTQHVSNLQGLVQMGRGQEADAIKGLTKVAGQAQDEAIGDVQSRIARKKRYADIAGTAAGIGTAHYLNTRQPKIQGLSEAQADWEARTRG